MENIDIFQSLVEIGPLGVVSVYFMVKDWKLNSELRAALNQFTIAINLLIKGGPQGEI